MRKAVIIGAGMTPVGEHWKLGLRDLAVEALLNAMEDAGIDKVDSLYVGNMISGPFVEQENLGALIADWAGLGNIPAVKIEAACASGGAAVQEGVKAVLSGLEDVVAVVGVEKMTDAWPSDATRYLAYAADAEWELFHGASFVALNALVMRYYMKTYGYTEEDLALFAVNAHANGAKNPYAMFKRPIKVETVLKSPYVADPLKLFDASPVSDGAASVIITTPEKAKELGVPKEKWVEVAGMGRAIDTISLASREDLLTLKAAKVAAERAYRMAGVEAKDIDFFEVHDAFTVMAALSLEALGVAKKGEGSKLAREGQIAIDADYPIQTMGGLKARGHPVGATGVYQTVEAVLQLRGEAPSQVPDAEIGLTQNIGGTGSNITVNVFRRV
ncbi:thiolase domain-containing protein [Thermococcus thioreducens]|uniref:Acetyl-CoA C-acetyltransferase n=1 Tax=Thermococcus thioreducens TaxID=277988 RepID=A0A0Q2XKK4_9EURY|nr:thiolase domain-containing protein [Thermococcus thioreducens]ASJ13120.1 acetyl-CoA acetyltransferase [Thermococcus thioreducens]KQH81628.1 acetyl-CoA acetyltransferase [Thermococcus thioreducens]SEV80838.1 acetyl-CoA C-acetyltransferase [Thermococcus thioreducens]